jgi:hypothetical protein
MFRTTTEEPVMTRQTAKPLHEYRTNVIDGIAWEITSSMRSMLILDPPYQRGTVWTESQRIALVSSWIRGLPIQNVIMNDRRRWEQNTPEGRKRYVEQHIAVIDGKQRIETALAWFDSLLPVPASWFDPEDVEATVETADGPYVTFGGLTIEFRRHAKFSWKLPRMEVFLDTVQDEADLYLLVNGGGTPQTMQDMANAAKVARR